MRTGKKCLPLSFVDIAQGKLGEIPSSTTTKRPADEYDLVICSFALHLVGDASEMFSLLYDLSRRSRWLAVIAPHKKPEVRESLFCSLVTDGSLEADGRCLLRVE